MIDRHDGGMEFKGHHPSSEQFRHEFDMPEIADRQLVGILGLVRDRMLLEVNAYEMMVERMLTDPRGWGILQVGGEIEPINFDEPLPDMLSMRYEYALDEGVPFGHTFQLPTWEAVERWREAGCPL